MSLDSRLWTLDPGPFPPRSGILAVEPQREALGAAAGLDELVERCGDRFEATCCKILMQAIAAAVRDNLAADNHGIAGEPLGLVLLDFDQLVDRFGDGPTAVVVEGGRVINCQTLS